MQRGLYGLVIVEDPKAAPMRKEGLFMAETTGLHKGDGVPPYIMNGLGIPGGELGLEDIYKQRGLQGVVAQLRKTVPYYKIRVGEPMKLHAVQHRELVPQPAHP